MSEVSHLRIFRGMKRFFFAMVLCIGTVVTSGCTSPTDAQDVQQVLPAPVTARGGMQLVWGPDVKKAALKLIQSSHREVYLDMYELSDKDIIQALVAARKRNVDVRVVLDATEPHSTSVGYPSLRADGVTVREISIKQGIDHVKMLTTDAGTLIGGMNFGANSWNNNDASVLIPHANSEFRTMFLWDFSRAAGEAIEAPTLPPPLIIDGGIESALVQAIQSARQTIDMEAFDLSDKALIQALGAALARGVAVTILVDPTQSYNRSTVDTLRDAGAMVRYYRPYDGELMHAKILDVDHGATFIIGSANFSHQAFTYNHEADLELHDVPQFDASLREDLQTQMGRGSDYPMKAANRSWG
ncbi:hypothetical protein N007_00845 [Alicyclobacillus acidoterrestris ATCC 49025]|nr:hypothetical protein N007_00845 [Alicyclobacillus acidoterrestris ATCC 49025]